MVLPARRINDTLKEASMEYTKEFENLKQEINRSGKTIEGLSGLLKNFSNIGALQESIKKFQDNNVLSRIETKIDILAESDPSEIFNLIIDQLNADLADKYNTLSEKMDALKELKGDAPTTSMDIEDISEIKESLGLLSSNYQQLISDLNEIRQSQLSSNVNNSLDKINERFSGLQEQISEIGQLVQESHSPKRDIDIENILSLIPSLNGNIPQLAEGSNDEAGLIFINENLCFLHERLKVLLENNATSEEVKGIQDALKTIKKEIAQDLYPVQNLQTVSESLQAAQDKLNILIDIVSNNFPENVKSMLDLDNKFGEINFKLDSQVINALSSLKDCVNEIQDKQYSAEEIRDAFSFMNHSMEKLEESLKYSTANNMSEEVLDELLKNIHFIKASVDMDDSDIKLEEITNKLADLDSKITGLQEISQFKGNIDFIKNNLSQLEEKFNYTNEKIAELANFSTNTSVQEELSEKINRNSEVLNEFLRQFNDKVETLGNGDINQLKEGINSLSVSVKSSEAVMNAILDNLNSLNDVNTRNEDQLSVTNETLSEINSKVNRLIITSNDNVESLRNDIKANSVARLSGELRAITRKVENVDTIKDAMLQMAEWIDSAGKLLEDNNDNIKKSMVNTKRFENFEIRMESIEAKLEQLLDRVDRT
ncbi:MAG: hypothetical protein A2Y25_08590 [Candidatus Melainabacteria bacterium GWF2_37_15]|nr:MAG: hypothetical protein A2Y25_08590 [Candidatus Melainabacteria bacterium GWF2_37_15]